jgi:hypothetical protein
MMTNLEDNLARRFDLIFDTSYAQDVLERIFQKESSRKRLFILLKAVYECLEKSTIVTK